MGIKKNEPCVEQESKDIDLILKEMDNDTFENNFKQKIKVPPEVKLYSIKMKIEEDLGDVEIFDQDEENEPDEKKIIKKE